MGEEIYNYLGHVRGQNDNEVICSGRKVFKFMVKNRDSAMRYACYTLIFSFFFGVFQCGCAIAAKKDVEFTISCDKDEYKKTDPVMIDLKLKNRSKKPIYVNKRFYVGPEDSPKKRREVDISVISPGGERLPYTRTYEPGLPKTDYFVLLDPGEEAGLERKLYLKSYFDMKEAGTYEIRATYRNSCGDEIGIDAFTDKIDSNTVTIKIVE